MRGWLTLGAIFWAVGCASSGGQKPAVDPSAATAPTPATNPNTSPPHTEADPWTLPAGPREETQKSSPAIPLRTEAWAKASKTKGIAPAKPACLAFARRTKGPAKPTDLVAAILEKDPSKRDAMLVAFEGDASRDNPEAAMGLRAIRAELAPIECADAIVDPILSANPEVKGAAGHALVGLSLAAKLARAAEGAPVMKNDTSDKEKVKRFIQGPLRTWLIEQATAIDALSAAGVELSGLGRGIAAAEAGMADLRLVDRIRSAPVPASWDAELKAVYEAALDEALEPRKTRGRDAALVGLADFAVAGVARDSHIDRARLLLSKLYGGRRIDALDGLLLTRDELPPAAIPETVLALVPADGPGREWFAKMNVAPPTGVRSPRARLEMGKLYWRRVDFVEAAHAAAKTTTPDARLVLALALALAKGPNGAKEMMTAPSPAALGLNHTEALDALAKDASATAVAGTAAYDAALLRSLSPPEGEGAKEYLADVAARFRKAAALLEDSAQKKRAEERAADADAASKARGGAAR
jgi:hypothetical protein